MKQGGEPRRKTSNDSNQTNSTTTTSKLSSSFDGDYSLDSTSITQHHPSISISSSDNTASKDKPVIRKPLVPPKPRSKSVSSSKDTYDIQTPPSTAKKNINNNKNSLDEEDIPAGYDPIEYDYLMSEQNEDDSTNDLGLLSRSTKSASNDCLVSISIIFHYFIILLFQELIE